MAQKTCYLVVGNPGTGKSTILNGLIGKPKFVSKTSKSGSGVTFQFDKQEIAGKVYMDTPGLSDETLREKAAVAITTALKEDSFYRIFFVVTEEAGRVRPDDKTTIKLILDASPEITDYSIIVNKVTKKWVKNIMKPDNLKPWLTLFMSGLPVTTTSIHFMSRDEDLEDEDDVEYTAPQDVIDFVEGAPGMMISKSSVSDVKASEFDEMKKQNERLLSELQANQEKMKAETDRLEKAMKAKVEEMAKQAEENEKRLRQEVDSAKKAAKEAPRDTRGFWGKIGDALGDLWQAGVRAATP